MNSGAQGWCCRRARKPPRQCIQARSIRNVTCMPQDLASVPSSFRWPRRAWSRRHHSSQHNKRGLSGRRPQARARRSRSLPSAKCWLHKAQQTERGANATHAQAPPCLKR